MILILSKILNLFFSPKKSLSNNDEMVSYPVPYPNCAPNDCWFCKGTGEISREKYLTYEDMKKERKKRIERKPKKVSSF